MQQLPVETVAHIFALAARVWCGRLVSHTVRRMMFAVEGSMQVRIKTSDIVQALDWLRGFRQVVVIVPWHAAELLFECANRGMPIVQELCVETAIASQAEVHALMDALPRMKACSTPAMIRFVNAVGTFGDKRPDAQFASRGKVCPCFMHQSAGPSGLLAPKRKS